jgi:predicted acylesterase/phospholipase RssA/CRP-like cAMP-binding protein
MPEDSSLNIAEFLAASQLFRGISRDLLDELAAKFQSIAVTAGEHVLGEGEQDPSLFLIVFGEVRVLIPAANRKANVEVDLGQGQSIGEIGFLTGVRRSATVTALSDTQLLRLFREDFEVLARQSPLLQTEVTTRIVRHVRRVHLSTALRASDLFGSLNKDALLDMEKELEFISLATDEVLFNRGETGNDFYFVINGRLRVWSAIDSAEGRAVVELGPGDTVGEMAVLTNETRAATVSAVRDSQLAKLSRDAFQRLTVKHPEIVAAFFTRKMASLMRTPIREAAKGTRPRTFAVIAARPGVALQEFCARITEALSRLGSTFLLSSETIDSLLGCARAAQATDESSGRARITQYLNNLESEFQYLLYQADGADSEWTRRCIRQADHTLVIADADADAAPCGVEAGLILGPHGQKNVSLVLTYTRSEQRPSQTIVWLTPRSGYKHHHVRLKSDDDLQRLARLLTGNGVGLVLSGGFARGMAHAGVIRALKEANVPIDLIGGTSMGAIIGAMHAVGIEPERMVSFISGASVALRRDVTIPLVSLNSGRTMLHMARQLAGENQIEDLWIPYFCVSASLSSMTMKVHSRGSLLRCVLASSRAPGIFPPIVWDNDVLVDGGIVNNLPVDVMRKFANGGTVIAVDCAAAGDSETKHEDYGLVVSGPLTLLRRLNPFRSRTKIPNIFNVLIRTISFGSTHDKQNVRGLADLYLQPPIQSFRFHDFKKGPQIAEAAYQYSKKMIIEWLHGAGRAAAFLCVRGSCKQRDCSTNPGLWSANP